MSPLPAGARGGADRGFTLVELMIVLVVVAIGALVATPSLREALVAQRLRAAATDFSSSLLMARSEAIKRGAQMRVEPRSAGAWTSGWRVVGVDEGDQVDRKDALGDGVNVDRAPDSIVYVRTGRLADPGVVRVQFADDVQSALRTRCVTIDPSGLPRIATGSCP